MALDDEDSTWLLALESALLDGADDIELISITRGRVLPEEHRAQIWYSCLGGATKISKFSQFDEIFDLPEQSVLRADCRSLVDKLGNEDEDKVSILCDVESIFTHYCKTRHLQYDSQIGWGDVIVPMLSAKMPRDHIYVCFEEILEKYIPRETGKGSPVYHLLRLLLLYHDPELSTFLDSRKITPDLYATSWMQSLFSSKCSLSATTAAWDIYFQEKDPFFILFLSIVILVNAREQIISMDGETRENIIETVSNIPSALSVNDVPDFCSLARYYIVKTPNTFKKEFSTVVFGSVFMGRGETGNQVGDLPLSQALCLPVSAEEIIETCDMNQIPQDDVEQVQFFLVDCRPSEQYNAGHLPNAFHLDSSLMLQQPSQFQIACQGLFMAQRQAMAAETPGCGQHLCFIGSGREQEDQYVHMVVASFLQRNTHFISLAKGGYQALHDVLVHNINESLSEHDTKRCLVCAPDCQSQTSEPQDQDDFTQKSNNPQPSIANKFSSFSSVFKLKSSEMKEKLVEYITNPNGETIVPDRHVSSRDKVGKLYRGQGDVFSLDEDDRDDVEGNSGFDAEENANLEIVNIKQWIKKPDVISSFTCHQVKENGYMYPCHILLMDTLLFIIREREGSADEGAVTARRTLASIVKITSKKKHPDLITFKYGTTTPDGEVAITDMDRFLISKASEATKVIKQQIMKQIDGKT